MKAFVERYSQITRKKESTQARYRADVPIEVVEKQLKWVYAVNVERTGMKLQADKYTRENISGAAWWITAPEARPWLLLWGKYGNGKTTLGDSVMETINTYMSLRPSEVLPKYCSMEKISAIEVGQASREDGERFQKMISKPMLFIDDWGAEPNIVNNYGTVISPMANLIFYRYEHRLMTIISANMTMDQIEKNYGPRISDRIVEVADKIGFNQKSYRK